MLGNNYSCSHNPHCQQLFLGFWQNHNIIPEWCLKTPQKRIMNLVKTKSCNKTILTVNIRSPLYSSSGSVFVVVSGTEDDSSTDLSSSTSLKSGCSLWCLVHHVSLWSCVSKYNMIRKHTVNEISSVNMGDWGGAMVYSAAQFLSNNISNLI